jgi:hypothetical protein
MNEQEREPLMLLEALVLAKQLGNGHFVGRWNEKGEWADPECRFYTNGCGLIWDATNAERDPSLSEAARIIRPARALPMNGREALEWLMESPERTVHDDPNSKYPYQYRWGRAGVEFTEPGSDDWSIDTSFDFCDDYYPVIGDNAWEDVTAQVRVVVE